MGDRIKQEKKLGALRNVLYAYARRNPTVGYCQGLNFIVAQLLRHLDEEEAFWVLCSLIECILPLDYYTAMIGVLVDQAVFAELVENCMPNLFNAFKKLSIDPTLVSMQWFICLFSQNVQPDVSFSPSQVGTIDCRRDLGPALPSWLRGIIQGRTRDADAAGEEPHTLHRVQYGARVNPMVAEVFGTLEKEAQTIRDVRALVQTMSLEKFSFITNRYVRHKRTEKRGAIYHQVKEGSRSRKASGSAESKSKYIQKLVLYNNKLENSETIRYDKAKDSLENAALLVCDAKWPLCLYDHTYKNRCATYFAFRCGTQIHMIDDYFETLTFVVSSAEITPPSLRKVPYTVPAREDAAGRIDLGGGFGLALENIPDMMLNEGGAGETLSQDSDTKDPIESLTAALPHPQRQSQPPPQTEIQLPQSVAAEPYDSLLVERGVHYCTNKEFVAKMTRLLVEQKNEAAFEDKRVDGAVNSEVTLLNAMDEYVDRIMDYGEEKKGAVPARPGAKTEDDLPQGEEEEERLAAHNQTIDLGEIREKWDFGLWRKKSDNLTAYLNAVAQKMPFKDSGRMLEQSPCGEYVKKMVGGELNI